MTDTAYTGNGRTMQGTVVKAAMKDTVTVSVKRYVQHPKYKKYYTLSKKYLVHNPGNTARVGDVVEIKETRPISKLKRFALARVVREAARGEE